MTVQLESEATRPDQAADGVPARAERMTGVDAMFLHAERPDTPFHTLKVMVLDPAHRGRDLTLEEIAAVLPAYLGLVRRSTQRIEVVPGFGGRPFWVEDPDFDLRHHLDERRLPAPGGRADLDRLCADLAVEQLDRSRPLWALTLVHGLAGGRQALVVRVHHAIMDGIAALNAFLAATGERRGAAPAPASAPAPAPAAPAQLARQARAELRSLAPRVGGAVRAYAASQRATRAFGSLVEVPRGLTWRSSLNRPSRSSRLCASGTLELDEVKRLARATGVTLNGALHAVLAEALREEFGARGESADRPLVAIFGVAEDRSSGRTHGNGIATARAYLRLDLADPLDRLHATARSCLLAVDLRRRRGFELTKAASDLTGRLMPRVRAGVAKVTPRVLNHITTANVPGPDHRRWLGDLEVVDWISFAVAVAPADVNFTAYTYAGRFSIGLVATPESMPYPREFLARLQPALDRLLAAVLGSVAAG